MRIVRGLFSYYTGKGLSPGWIGPNAGRRETEDLALNAGRRERRICIESGRREAEDLASKAGRREAEDLASNAEGAMGIGL